MKQALILDWFEENKRDLPWRKTTPWGVMISEFMLQQTPVNRVLPIWQSWITRWPTPEDLANERKSEAISAWGRLGYPRRAIRLHESAQIIRDRFNNEVPRAIEDLRTLPGVGEYTAAAIASFAFHESTLVMDINIRRLFARAIDGIESATTAPSQIERRVRAQLIPNDGSTWAAATMELGALICTARSPSCDLCPIKSDCNWRAAGYPKSELPKRTQAWAGTDRQCRGLIIAHLREHKVATKEVLSTLWHEAEQFEKCLKSLMADSLIEETGHQFSLAN